jgi:hypothetical protein
MKRNGGLRKLVLRGEYPSAPMFHPRMSSAHQPRTLRCTPAGIGCTPRIERPAGIRCGSSPAADSVLRPGRLAVRRLRVGAGDRGAIPELGPGCAAHGPGACGATAPAQPRRAAPACGSSGPIEPTRCDRCHRARTYAGARRGEGVAGLIFKLSFDPRPWPTLAQKFPGFELFQLWTTK